MKYSFTLLNFRASIQNDRVNKARPWLRKALSLIIFIFFCCISGKQAVFAQWSPNAPVSALGGQHPGIASDQARGAIIASFVSGSIVVQRIDSNGVAQWGGGITIGSGMGQQVPVAIIADEVNGGAIITWISPGFDIYAQRITRSGILLWAGGGVPVCTAPNNQLDPSLVSDGAGGAIITWYDYRSGTAVYAQHIDGSGAAQWVANGIVIGTTSTGTANSYGPRIVSDNAGGAIISWTDSRNGNPDIYAQRISVGGVVEWLVNGAAICDLASNQGWPEIAADGTGGAIIAWEDNRNGNIDIYAQRVSTSGVAQWSTNGVPVCTLGGSDISPRAVSDGTTGAIIIWGRSNDIYAQKINSLGELQWTPNPVAITTAADSQATYEVAGDGAGGALVTWMDLRSGTFYNIYAQKITNGGAVQWTSNGTAIYTPGASQGYPVIVNNGMNGAIVGWNRNPPVFGVLAQNVNADGTIGPLAITHKVCPGDNDTLISPLTGTTYQWQVNDGTGYTNIIENGEYFGVNERTLYSINVPSTRYGYLYRCLVDGIYVNTFKLIFSTTWEGGVSNDWEDPANWACYFKPDGNTDVVINSGTVVVTVNTIVRSLTIAPGVNFTVAPGVTLTVTH